MNEEKAFGELLFFCFGERKTIAKTSKNFFVEFDQSAIFWLFVEKKTYRVICLLEIFDYFKEFLKLGRRFYLRRDNEKRIDPSIEPGEPMKISIWKEDLQLWKESEKKNSVPPRSALKENHIICTRNRRDDSIFSEFFENFLAKKWEEKA